MTLPPMLPPPPVPAPSPAPAVATPQSEVLSAQAGRRRVLLTRSALPVAVALVTAVKLLSMSVAGASAVRSFEAGSAEQVATAASWMEPVNVVERYKAPWARGDAAVLAGDYTGARASFERALGLVADESPDGCRIRANLALALAHLAADSTAAGETTAARDYLIRVREVADAAPPGCRGAEPDGPGERIAAAAAQAGAALQALQSPPADPDGSIAARQKALIDRLRQSVTERARSGPGGTDQTPVGGGGIPAGAKPW